MRALAGLALLALAGCAGPEPVEVGPDEPGPRDLLIVNARFVGLEGDALLVSSQPSSFRADAGTLAPRRVAPGEWRYGGLRSVVAIGVEDKVRALAGREVDVVDAERGLVLPGFHDAHSHALAGGLASEEADLTGARTLQEALDAVRAWAEAHPDAPWVVGRGWSYDLVPRGEFPTRQMLDRAVPDRPALLEAYDGHASWANTKALEVAGVGPETDDPDGGRVVREADGQTPQGTLLEGAAALVGRHVPPPDRATQLAALERALDSYLRLGVTSVQALCGSLDEVGLYEELLARGRLPVRVVLALPLETPIERVVEARERLGHERPDWLRVGFLKGFLDGVIESRTAFMLEPYAGTTDERGAPLYTPERLTELVSAAHAAGVPVALHAVGDGAVRMALDTFEAVGAAHQEQKVRHRIEHIEVVHPDDLPRFRALDVVASMQPYHAVPSDSPDPDDVWSANLGPERLTRAFAWRALLDAGAPLAFGSDWPVFTHEPLRGLAVAVTRKNERGLPADGWQAHQAITFAEAARACTEGAAYAVGDEGRLGALRPGARADLVILSRDVRPEDPPTLWTGTARVVVLDGRVVVGR
ncbi:MAG: amidohydrolase [Planctomycetes bacterium]|nr:amidohydrolase [Planctomycetota bacterium]